MNEIRRHHRRRRESILDLLSFTAKNAVQGLREVRERRPQVVLFDLNMLGLRAHTALEHLTSSPSSPSIIIVSGNNDEADTRTLLQRGAFDYITKPIDLTHSQSVIATAAAAPPTP